MRIARTIEFDAGHRVPSHDGKCRSPHGHRYKVEAVLDGPVTYNRERADDGMVLDFGKLKAALDACVHDPMDHAFLVAREDSAMRQALATDVEWKVYLMHLPPTAENLAYEIATRLMVNLDPLDIGPARLVEVTVWETPNCWARWAR